MWLDMLSFQRCFLHMDTLSFSSWFKGPEWKENAGREWKPWGGEGSAVFTLFMVFSFHWQGETSPAGYLHGLALYHWQESLHSLRSSLFLTVCLKPEPQLCSYPQGPRLRTPWLPKMFIDMNGNGHFKILWKLKSVHLTEFDRDSLFK